MGKSKERHGALICTTDKGQQVPRERTDGEVPTCACGKMSMTTTLLGTLQAPVKPDEAPHVHDLGPRHRRSSYDRTIVQRCLDPTCNAELIVEDADALQGNAEIVKIVFVPGASGGDYAAYAGPIDWDDSRIRGGGSKLSPEVAQALKRQLFHLNLLTSSIMRLTERP